MPTVSIIMPTYNCGKYIAESINSVLAQTMSDWELEIVDDCSIDNTKSILAPYLKEHKNIHYYCLQKNGGPAVARTEAIRRATGRYIAFLDSDDLWTPEKLEKQIAYMEEKNVLFSCTGYSQIDEQGKPLNIALIPPHKTDYNKCIRLSDPIGNLTVMYDQKALGKFEVPMIKKRNDFALWLKILRIAPYCAGMPDVLGIYRIRSNSVSSNKLALVKYQWELYHEIEKHGIIRSTCEIVCWAIVKGTGIGLCKKKM